MTQPEPLYITTRAGLRLHASDWAPEPGKPVCILLHGFGHCGRIWDPLSQSLQNSFRVIALDFRGHGDSDWDPEENYCHRSLSQDIDELVNSLGITEFHLVGHSLGARIATLYAELHTDRVASLTIIDAGPEVGDKGADKIRADAENLPVKFESIDHYFRWLAGHHLFAERDRLLALARAGVRKIDGAWVPKTDPGFTRALWKQDSRKGGSADLSTPLTDELWNAMDTIQCPTLVIRGQISSILSRATAEEMAYQRLSKGQLVTIERAGHGVMLDNAPDTVGAISRFLLENLASAV